MTNEEAIPILRQIAGSYGDVKKYNDAMWMAIEALEQQKQGEWKWVVDSDDENIYHLQCSICHGSGFDEHLNYCPNCGARMVRGEEMYESGE